MSYRTSGPWPTQAGGVPRPPIWPNPAVRASTADRQRYTDYIGMAYASGQLDDAEMSARLDQALRATTLGQLDGVVADLNFARMAPATPTQTVVPVQPAPVPVKRRRHRLAKAVVALVVVGALAWGAGSVGHALGLWSWQPGPQMGDRQMSGTYAYWDFEQLPEDLSLDAGPNSVDLTRLTVSEDRTMEIEQDAGQLNIKLPADANVVVHYDLSVGSVNLTAENENDRTNSGIGPRGTATWNPNPGGPVLTIEVSMDVGTITIG